MLTQIPRRVAVPLLVSAISVSVYFNQSLRSLVFTQKSVRNMASSNVYTELPNGRKIPMIGLGTWNVSKPVEFGSKLDACCCTMVFFFFQCNVNIKGWWLWHECVCGGGNKSKLVLMAVLIAAMKLSFLGIFMYLNALWQEFHNGPVRLV